MNTSQRFFQTSRRTKETDVRLSLNLDGGEARVSTGIGFFDHMLNLFAVHGGFGLDLVAEGDTDVDFHHTVEDAGIVLGRAFYEAAGDKAGINRYGFFILPMDEALAETAVDFGGRSHLAFDVRFLSPKIGGFDAELVEEFWRAFAFNAKCSLHIIVRYGSNGHHIAEAVFKSAARSLREALRITGAGTPSTKGSLD